jgi:ribosomal protein S18 acetylase RimI-like enzyme
VPPLEIRPMAAREIEEVVGVWERSRWDAQPWLEERMGYRHEQNLEHFREVVARENEVWLALEDGEVVGLLALGNGQIDQLFVEPQSQGGGVGTRMLQKARELAPRGLTLFTHQRNERARAFYERRGFRAVRFGVSPPPESEPDVKYLWEPASDPAE